LDSSAKSTKAFIDAIKKLAAAECKKIDEETYVIKRQGLKRLKKESKGTYREEINYEVNRISSERNISLSEMTENSKRELVGLRRELFDKVFENVGKEIEKYVGSDKYRNFLISGAEEISRTLTGEGIVYYVREADLCYSDAVRKALGKDIDIRADGTIKFGGIRAEDTETGCLADNTIDSRLEAQKDWFVQNSGLKV